MKYYMYTSIIIEGSLEVKLPFPQYGQMKSRDGQRQREENSRREQIRRRERVRRKKMQMREKVGKSRNTMFFQ